MFACWWRITSFDTECFTEMSYNPSISKNRWPAFVAICVNRIGDGLRSLTVREKVLPIGWAGIEVGTYNLPSIGEGCPNVETINFVLEGRKWKQTLDIRFDSFSRLKTLTVSTAEADFSSASPSIFFSIPTSIEVIRGLGGKGNEPFDNAAQFEGFFADRPSLREIYLGNLYSCNSRKPDIFRVIAERCPHLKSIKLPNDYYDCIDYSGVVALESMKELLIHSAVLDEMKIVTICKRSPLVEALEFRLCFSSNLDLQSAALNALGALTKLGELRLCSYSERVVAPSLMTEFVHGLARNSGASLRFLDLPKEMPLPTAAIEALAKGCGKLRRVRISLRVGEAEPASILFFIDCIVADPSWIHQTCERTLVVNIYVIHDGGDEDEAEAGKAPFEALADPAANLPPGVELIIGDDYDSDYD